MTGDTNVLAARIQADKARAGFMHKVGELKQRLNPATIVGGAVERARDRSAALALEATGAVRASPALSGAALGLAILLIARGPFKRWRTRHRRGAAEAAENDLDHQRAVRPQEGMPS